MKRNVQQTSIEAYHDLKPIGERCKTVLVYINAFPNHTDMEYAKLMGVDSDVERPRRYDLMKAGLVEQSGTKICSETEKHAKTWRVKP
jgi:hypothetical protein